MQTVDFAGAMLTPNTFIKVFDMAKVIAPARFLTLRLHSDRYKQLHSLADVPKSIQLGPTPGPLGRVVMRVNCISIPSGVGDGMTVIQDDKVEPDRLVFEVHGIVELIIKNLAL